MYDPAGWDEDSPRPYFFLSYAHTPRGSSRGGGDPNHWVKKLYDDLCEEVMHLTSLPDGVPPGFMDQSMHQGQLWAERLSQELASCRVFIPLYSPRYFSSNACGQEWHAFTRRPVFPVRKSAERTSGIVPVLWVAMQHYQLPQAAREVQFNHSSFGPDYAAEGLYALMKLTQYKPQYEQAVHRLAQRIVDVAEETVIPPGRRLDFLSLPSAFPAPAPTPTKQLRISVFSARLGELPPGRSPDCYGPHRLDWNPYQPADSRPLVERAARLARQLGFQPSVHEFDQEAEEVLASGEPKAPGLVLLDRWALRDETRRDLVRKFDQHNPSWVSVLEPFSRDDPDCVDHHAELTELSNQTLRFKHREVRPSFHGGDSGLASLDDFDDALPDAAMRAKWGFEDRSGPEDGPASAPRRPGGPPGGGRPSFRGAFDSPPNGGERHLRQEMHRYGSDQDGGGPPPGAGGGAR